MTDEEVLAQSRFVQSNEGVTVKLTPEAKRMLEELKVEVAKKKIEE